MASFLFSFAEAIEGGVYEWVVFFGGAGREETLVLLIGLKRNSGVFSPRPCVILFQLGSMGGGAVCFWWVIVKNFRRVQGHG